IKWPTETIKKTNTLQKIKHPYDAITLDSPTLKNRISIKMTSKIFLCFLSLLLLGRSAYGQEEEKVDPDSSGVVKNVLTPLSTPVLLFTTVEEQEKAEKKEKKKK